MGAFGRSENFRRNVRNAAIRAIRSRSSGSTRAGMARSAHTMATRPTGSNNSAWVPACRRPHSHRPAPIAPNPTANAPTDSNRASPVRMRVSAVPARCSAFEDHEA